MSRKIIEKKTGVYQKNFHSISNCYIVFERKLTHLLRCCKILPNYKLGLMYSSTLRFQDFLRLVYGQLCEHCSSTSLSNKGFAVMNYMLITLISNAEKRKSYEYSFMNKLTNSCFQDPCKK